MSHISHVFRCGIFYYYYSSLVLKFSIGIRMMEAQIDVTHDHQTNKNSIPDKFVLSVAFAKEIRLSFIEIKRYFFTYGI